jgi:hypothetical protein
MIGARAGCPLQVLFLVFLINNLAALYLDNRRCRLPTLNPDFNALKEAEDGIARERVPAAHCYAYVTYTGRC